MRTNTRKWSTLPSVPSSLAAVYNDVHPVIAQILFNRGITDRQSIVQFLSPPATGKSITARVWSPFRLRGLNEAVTRTRQAIRNEEQITIYGDYDADGISATALLVQTISALGGQVTAFIPSRSDTGYGLQNQALNRIAQSGTTLLITVDCGVRDVSEVHYAAKRGLDVIVTDHHTVGDSLPPALAIINPKQPACKYPFKDLCGAGVAFKLAQGLLRVESRVPLRGGSGECALREEDLLDLVALGTVADLVPLLGENRYLVTQGLTRLRECPRLGLRHLIRAAGQDPSLVDSFDIGYRIGPRINAAGRIADPLLAYRLLVTTDEKEAEQLAANLNRLNKERQEQTHQMVRQAQAKLDDTSADILIVADTQFTEGLMGLVASSFAEMYYRPAVVIAMGESTSRGSARSIPEFNITKALDDCQKRLLRHGGHAMAAGFTVSNEELDSLKADLEAIATDVLANRDLRPTQIIDAQVPLREVTKELHEELEKLAPFGYGNKTPVLASCAVQVRDYRRVGAEKQHLKLSLSVPETSVRWDAIAFRQGDWGDNMPDTIDVAYYLEINHWNDKEILQLNVQNLRPTA